MTELFLQKLSLVVFLIGWLCGSTWFWFKGDCIVRKDFILSLILGFACSGATILAVYGIVFTVLFLIS